MCCGGYAFYTLPALYRPHAIIDYGAAFRWIVSQSPVREPVFEDACQMTEMPGPSETDVQSGS